MPLSSSTLATELKSMDLFSTEAAARTAWADAFHVYFQDAIAGVAGGINPTSLTACPAAMTAALTGMSASGAGAGKIQAGIVAYWGAIIPATAWPACTVITPPTGLSGLGTALGVVFAANKTGSVDSDTAYTAIANKIHEFNGSTAVATFPVPPGGIGPQPIT